MATQDERRAFTRSENLHLGRFLEAGDGAQLVGWSREYRCDCGSRCSTPGDIFDHVCEENEKRDVK